MKIFKTILISLPAIVLLLAGCRKEEYYFDVPSEIELKADANDTTLRVLSSGKWTMTANGDWFKISPKHADGDMTLRLTAGRNNTGMERTASLEFKSGMETRQVTIKQPAYTAEIIYGEVPASVTVKKGGALTISIKSNTDDWIYTKTDGEWLKEFDRNNKGLIFQLDPSVPFDESKPAILEFTTPSDPTFVKTYEIFPKNYFKFSVSAPESFDLGIKGGQYIVNIDSNIENWEYKVTNGAWLEEYSKGKTKLVFNGVPEKYLSETPAQISFSSKDYANLSATIQIKPIAPILEVPVDKGKMKIMYLKNDTKCTGEEYIFDNAWLINKESYAAFAAGDSERPTGYSYKSFGVSAKIPAREDANISFTIDAGEVLNLSKFITHFYYMYHANDPIIFSVYAYKGNNVPDGEWTADWVEIGTVDAREGLAEISKLNNGEYCSRLATGEIMSIDKEKSIPARYYRFKMKANGYRVFGMLDKNGVDYANGNCWQRGGWMSLSEITIYKHNDN